VSVWFVLPTACPQRFAQRCFDAWRDQGYKVAIIRDEKDSWPLSADICLRQPEYLGYGLAVNKLAKHVLAVDPSCYVIVVAGDDIYPCTTKRADEIAGEFLEHFRGTLGVMQTHGNEGHHRAKDGSYVPDTVAWSPWLGFSWIKRAYEGAGPIHPGFYHYWSTTNLHDVANRLGLYWYRTDIIQWDDNWKHTDSKRKRLGKPKYIYKAKERVPADHALYLSIKANGYPGCGLLP
jgi:hypothetical protein